MYLLDSDVFIQAKNLHYGFDFCPAFWGWLDREYASGLLASIEKVKDELKGVGDELADWAGERPDFFLAPDSQVLASLGAASEWATQSYDPAAVNTFLQVADYFLISHAHAHGFTVVTHERAAPLAKKIKIPDACIGLGVKCVTPFEMLRTERARFILGEVG